LAVNVSPKTVLPVIVTVPVSAALLVLNVAGELGGEAKCVAVSGLYASKV
jgi:hypothetical protein